MQNESDKSFLVITIPAGSDNWKPLDPTHHNPVDCAINVLNFLGILDSENSKQLSKLKNTINVGTLKAEINFFLSSYDKKWIYSNYSFKNAEEIYGTLTKILANNTAILAFFERANAMGHAVIFAKVNYKIVIYDPQNTKVFIIKNAQSIVEFMSGFGYVAVSTVLYEPNPQKDRIAVNKRQKSLNISETKINLRKKNVLDNLLPQKKRKITAKTVSQPKKGKKRALTQKKSASEKQIKKAKLETAKSKTANSKDSFDKFFNF
jgi:hypothetical protein